MLTALVAQSVALVVLVAAYVSDRAHWRAKESELLNRIRPDTAPAPKGVVVPVRSVDLTDDEQVWEALNETTGTTGTTGRLSAGGGYR